MKLIIQNIMNPLDKRVVENKKINCSYPQNFQPLTELRTEDTLYLYYDKAFELVKLSDIEYSIRKRGN